MRNPHRPRRRRRHQHSSLLAERTITGFSSVKLRIRSATSFILSPEATDDPPNLIAEYGLTHHRKLLAALPTCLFFLGSGSIVVGLMNPRHMFAMLTLLAAGVFCMLCILFVDGQKNVVGFMSEAIQGVGGIIELAAVYNSIRKAGGLCIADEVQAGSGTHFWGFESQGVVPDIVTMAKAGFFLQDTLKSPPSESKTMKKAAKISIAVTTIFYLLCGCFGYDAFGDSAPGNLLAGFGTFNPFWIVDIANIAIVVHLFGAYQVFTQSLYSFVELKASQMFPASKFVTEDIKVYHNLQRRHPTQGRVVVNHSCRVWSHRP